MNPLAYEQRDNAWSSAGDEEPIPRRPRRQLLNRRSATLLALLTAAAGFYAGVRIEKGQLSGASTTGSGTSALAAGLRARASAAGAGGAAGSAGAAAGASRGAAAGFPGLLGGAGGAGATSFGTISTVSGRTLYVSSASGNTIKVKLSGATKVTKSLGVSHSSLRPGDTVIVRGVSASNGTVNAATVSDSGSSSTGATASSGSSSSSGSSAVGSLFSNSGKPGGG